MNSVRNQYRGEEGANYHQNKRAIPATAYPWVAKMRAAKFAGFIQNEDRVLEYGVGSGWNLALLNCRRKLGYDGSAASLS